MFKENTTVKRRSKGEQTRNQILKSAIEVLASQGIKGTTHRAVANHAQLQLSLTTYYFKDIQELVHQAFMLSSNITAAKAGAAWLPVFEYLDSFNKTQLKKVSIREELREKLTQTATQYLVDKITKERIELSIEQLLFTEIQITPQLRELAHNHRNALLSPFVQLSGYFNNTNAELDGDILLTVFTQLEYRNLTVKPEELDIQYIEQAAYRVISWILQVK